MRAATRADGKLRGGRGAQKFRRTLIHVKAGRVILRQTVGVMNLISSNTVNATRRSVFLPKEHGSWSLALEPLALGLLVAPSLAGGALAVAAVAGFFARRPLKAALAADGAARCAGAVGAFALLAACSAGGVAMAAWLGGFAALWPLLLAIPFGALFLQFDRQNESRAAAAELAGSVAFALLPAALATLAGWRAAAALALAAVMLARSVPTVLTVRAYLRVRKGAASRPVVPLLAAGAALPALWWLRAQHLAPTLAPVLAAVLFARTVFLVTPLRPVWPARAVGFIEAALGFLFVALLALGWTKF